MAKTAVKSKLASRTAAKPAPKNQARAAKPAPRSPGKATGIPGQTTAFQARYAQYYAQEKDVQGSSSFVSLEDGDNVFRIVYDPDQDKAPFVLFSRHTGVGANGKFAGPLNLDFVAGSEQAREKLGDKLTDEDYDLISQYGDPAVRLLRMCYDKEDPLPKALTDLRNKPWLQTRALLCVVKNGAPGIVETSYKQFQIIKQLDEENEDLFSIEGGRDIKIVRENKNKRISYQDARVVGKPYHVEFVGALPDLWKSLRNKVMGYREKVKFLAASYPEFVEFADAGPGDFGVEEM